MDKFKNFVVIIAHILLISAIWIFSVWVHENWLDFFPATIIALFLILLVVSVFDGFIAFFDRGAYFLIAHMMLMFIPLLVLAAENKEFFTVVGLKIAFVMFVSTVLVMLTVGITVKFLLNYLERRKLKLHADD